MHEIRWTEFALQQLDEIGTYIAAGNPTAAERVVRRIGEKVAALACFPLMGRSGRTAGTRELVVGDYPYIVVYRQSERIEILTVYHAARKEPKTR